MSMIGSYPSVLAIGHKMINGIFDDEVTVEEKIDGSQFSFGILDELSCRSKGKQIVLDAPEKMFNLAIEAVKSVEDKLVTGYIYRGEFLGKPKHNSLRYDRVPVNHIIIFDIMTNIEDYMPYDEKKAEAERLGFECVPLLFRGKVEDKAFFVDLLEKESVLGGTKIEGFVVKNYNLFTTEKKIAVGKYVSERFKEIHNKEWGASNPSGKDIIQRLIDSYRTEARWSKAVQHLRDAGNLDESPKDIGNLIKEVKADVRKECEIEIKEALFKHFYKNIERGLTAGLPEWYRESLLGNAFEPLGE